MEGPSKKSKIIREASRVRYYNFKCNLFLDWMLQANYEEQTWAKQTLMQMRKNDTRYIWEWDGPNLLLLVSQEEDVEFVFGRDGAAPRVHKDGEVISWFQQDFITKNPWLRREDNSVSILTKDVLVCIFSYFKTPKDLFSVTRVCKGWYNAGTTPALYERRIAALLARSHLEKPPFYDPLFQPHQYYFALSFFSCKSDLDLATKIMTHIHGGNIQLALFIRGLCTGWGHSPLIQGYTVYQDDKKWYLINNKRHVILISDRGVLDGPGPSIFSPWSGFSFDHPKWRPDFK